MTRRPSRRALHQLYFFRSRPKLPRWEHLPDDARRKTLPLISSLLRTALQAAKEASDER